MLPNGQGETYRERDLQIYLGIRFLSEAATLAQSVAIGWTVYRLSNAALALGIVGIVQFVPMFLLTLPAGELCDRVSPRRVLVGGLALQSICAGGFLLTQSAGVAMADFVRPCMGLSLSRAIFIDQAVSRLGGATVIDAVACLTASQRFVWLATAGSRPEARLRVARLWRARS